MGKLCCTVAACYSGVFACLSFPDGRDEKKIKKTFDVVDAGTGLGADGGRG